MKANDRDQRGVVVEFPTTAKIAARRYEREIERIARGSAKNPRINRRISADYHRLCCEPWPGEDR